MAKKNQDQAAAASAPSPKKPAPSKRPAQRAASGMPWHPAWRWLVSLLLVLHLAAVFVAPWNLSTDPALPPSYVAPAGSQQLPPRDSTVWQQPLVPQKLHRFFNYYLNLAYLNHGYQFFAPDPAGSNLIRYQVWDSGGTEIAAGEFPNHDQQWPRLLYHRHMMLAAQTGDMGEKSGRLYAKHLIRLHGGQTARVEWILHKLLSPKQVLDETPQDAESTFVVLAEIRETADAAFNSNSEELPVAIPGAGR